MQKLLPVILGVLLACTACGDADEGHVWKDQTDMIDKAGEVENMLQETNRQQRQLIEDTTR